MVNVPEERREFQRLDLDQPMVGILDGVEVTIVEIGVLGARVRHSVPLDGKSSELRFTYDTDEITLRCEVVRTIDGQSGIRFLAAVGDSGDRLRTMLGDLVTKELERRRSVAADNTSPAVDGDKTVRGTAAGYVSYRLEDGVWRRRRVFLPEQPLSGFTVAHEADGEEIQQLRRVYQASDDEGRRLIRLFAELSVSRALQIPPKA